MGKGVCGKEFASFVHDDLVSADFLAHGSFESFGVGVGSGKVELRDDIGRELFEHVQVV